MKAAPTQWFQSLITNLMKTAQSLLALTCILALSAPLGLVATDSNHHAHGNPPAKAGAKHADYPLATCVVSGEELGSMGEPFDYVHKAPGQPDRLVRFCCESCVKKFKKDPAKYLAKIDAARDAKPAASAR